MRTANKIMRLFAWLAVFLMGTAWEGTCQLRAPGLDVNLENDDELYVTFPGGQINLAPGGSLINVPPFDLQIDTHDHHD